MFKKQAIPCQYFDNEARFNEEIIGIFIRRCSKGVGLCATIL
jgi:hypothetical protein